MYYNNHRFPSSKEIDRLVGLNVKIFYLDPFLNGTPGGDLNQDVIAAMNDILGRCSDCIVGIYNEGLGGGEAWGEPTRTFEEGLIHTANIINKVLPSIALLESSSSEPRLFVDVDNTHLLKNGEEATRLIRHVSSTCAAQGKPCTLHMTNGTSVFLEAFRSDPSLSKFAKYLTLENIVGDRTRSATGGMDAEPNQVEEARELAEQFGVGISLMGFGKLHEWYPGSEERSVTPGAFQKFLKANPWIWQALWSPDEVRNDPTVLVTNPGGNRISL